MSMGAGRRLRFDWWLITIAASVLVAGLTFDRTLMRIDNAIYDHLLRTRPAMPSEGILLVEIDDNSVRRVGRWPWSRATHARLIKRLQKAEPRAVSYDVLFVEPGEREEDNSLGYAIGSGAPVFVPMIPAPAGGDHQSRPVLPVSSVQRTAAGIGIAMVEPDQDGVVRSATLAEGPGRWLHLMEVMRRSLGGAAPERQRSGLIPFATGDRWPEVSAGAVLAGEVPDEILRGRIVMVGATASGLSNPYVTPFGRGMSGLEIQANLLHGLMQGEMIKRAGLFAQLALALVPLWVLMIALGPVRRIPPLAAFTLCAAGALLCSAIAILALDVWLPPAVAVAGLILAYPLWGWRQLAVSEEYMRAELERYESEPSVLPQPVGRRKNQGVASTIAMLRSAVASNREMRHFVTDRLEQLPDATLVSDEEGKILIANAAARRLLASLGQPFDRGTAVNEIIAVFRQCASGQSVPFPPDGPSPAAFEAQIDQARFFLVAIAEQTSAGAERSGWVIRFADISEAKAAQRQREDIVQLLTHDMRSPQASILAVLETAGLDRIAEKESRTIRQYAERTLGLADGFVQLARAENLDYACEEVALSDMVMDAIDDLWPQSKAKSIDIVIEGDEGLLVVAERSLLTRALVNVIGNAIKFGDQQSIITCTLARQSRDDSSAWACCSIKDQGPGLAAEQQSLIFQRFHRGPVGLGRRTEGVGLGLSFVHTVMVRHQGEIVCESDPGQGATFTLRLPLVN